MSLKSSIGWGGIVASSSSMCAGPSSLPVPIATSIWRRDSAGTPCLTSAKWILTRALLPSRVAQCDAIDNCYSTRAVESGLRSTLLSALPSMKYLKRNASLNVVWVDW